MERVKKSLSILLVLIVVIRLIFVLAQAPEQITNQRALREIWLHSQYNLDSGYEFYGNMSDEDLRTYAALEYITGSDPSIVNFEDPPLAKYLFGFFYLIFGNILVVQFIASAFALYLTYLIACRVSIPNPWSLIPSLILAFDPLFAERSTSVNLDLPQLVFVLLSLLLLTLLRSYTPGVSNTMLILIGFSIGASISSKVIFSGILLLLFAIAVFWLKKLPNLLEAIGIVLVTSTGVYLLSYFAFFAYHSPIDFVALHIKIARLYRSYLPEYPWFEIWRILLLGKWKTWFVQPPIQPVIEYWIAWPISTLAAGSLLFKRSVWRFPLKPQAILLGWAIVYLLFQSTHVVFPRYILLTLPILYLLGIWRLSQAFLINKS